MHKNTSKEALSLVVAGHFILSSGKVIYGIIESGTDGRRDSNSD